MARKKQQASTPATLALQAAGVSFMVHSYEHSSQAESYGGEAAALLGVSASRVFKTLMVATGPTAATGLAVAVVPVDGSLDLKAAGMALGSKKLVMADSQAAQRRTGYVLGGISPFGQRQSSPAVFDSSALEFDTIFISGGRRGLSLELDPADAARVAGASWASIAARRPESPAS